VRVSASLIVRDEERYLDACLSHLKGKVDEIVIIDTGSVDRSIEIASAHGALVYEERWLNDFSHARNVGLERSSSDWILYIDADEHLHADRHLGEALGDAGAIAARVRFRAAQNLTPYPEYRLFRNRPDIRFRGVIHETIVPDLQVLLADKANQVIDTPFAIEHYGYEGDLTHKHQRNRDKLLQALCDDPQRIYLWLTLGECEKGLGNIDAAQSAWREGLARVRAGKTHPVDVLIYARLMSLHFNGRAVLPDIAELLFEARAGHGEDPLILWWSAQSLLLEGNPAAARKEIEKILAHGPEGPAVSSLGYERRLFGESGWGLLGVCYLSEGKVTEAVEWLQRAHEANPENTEVTAKLAVARARLSRSATIATPPG
jgi:glycosyltransferase involved in cell wall biosynthesis